MTNEADDKFDVKFNFNSILDSYKSHYEPYNASWLMDIYYTYQVNYSCNGMNKNIQVFHMHHNDATVRRREREGERERGRKREGEREKGRKRDRGDTFH